MLRQGKSPDRAVPWRRNPPLLSSSVPPQGRTTTEARLLYLTLLAGLYLAWGIGANDSSKVFAPAVVTNSIRYKTAMRLLSVFVILGALTQGHILYEAYEFGGGGVPLHEATIATAGAAFAVMVATLFALPVSTSQAGVGGMIGVTLFRLGGEGLDWALIEKMFLCWVLTPPVSAVLAFVLYHLLRRPVEGFFSNPSARSRFLQASLVVFGCYEAYTLGANHVVVTTGPFYKAGLFGPPGPDALAARVLAAGVASLAIAFGALTFARRVMETFGKKVTVLDPYSAVMVMIASGTTLEIFTLLHVPISTTQAGVGALVGVGLTKGQRGVSYGTLARIVSAWFVSPLVAGLFAFLGARIYSGWGS